MVTLENVSKRYGPVGGYAVRSVSMTVEPGETVVLLGTSGCGKTTTLKMINRLIDPTSGRILVDGRDVMEENPMVLRRRIGYVFQNIGLFPHMSVERNVAIVPRLCGVSPEDQRERAHELMAVVGLDPGAYAARRPEELSGGQQQRVGIARALAGDPAILLMDEPFGALDAVTRDQLQGELVRLRAELNKTIVFVTHDLFEAVRLGDRIAVMRAGVIEQLGTPGELMNRPATPFVEELFGHARRQAALIGASGAAGAGS
ncbi:MAG: ATP-binding cassette domain-containing protein [Phycisphaerales bacterium]|nr:ATP-binding cassette domain-containing protein [Planctomycetota bacterium]MCH8507350.1 ATP-binding cassette domain-containing protein [Phycisphaerales bacterium]